jgi:hypothetical protein
MIPEKTKTASEIVEDVVTKGDLSKLNSEQRTIYYRDLCASLGLTSLTQPFDWLVLNGKLQLYANRRCADQLRKINGISIAIISQDYKDGLLTFHVKAKDKTGREDEDLGVVSLPNTLSGEARANTILKAVTKAKRRVTLSISGLGFLDETEVEDIPAQAKEPPPKDVTPPAEPKPEPPSKAAKALTEIAADRPITENVPPQDAAAATSAGEPREVVLGDDPDWIWFGQQMIALCTSPDWSAWNAKNSINFQRMMNEAPKVFARMSAAIAKARDAMEKPQEPAKKRGRPKKQPELKDDPEAYLSWLENACKEINKGEGKEAIEADYMTFIKSQGEVLGRGFPSDQAAANDIIKRYMPRND